MPSCAFLRCTNDSKRKNKAHGITFHAFPTDEAWKRKWLTVVRTQRYEPEWMSTKNSRICSIHFHADHVYTTNRGRRRITKGAVPFFQPAMVSADYATLALSPKSSDAESIDSIRSTRKTPKKGLGKGQTVKHKKNNKKIKKSDGLRGVLKKLKRKIIISEEHFSEVFLKAEAAEHYLKLTSTKNTKKTRVPFSSRLREFALTLHLYSPVGYRYVRKVFDNALPHPGILKKWHENHTAAPGFTGQAFAALKKKYTTAKKRLLCALIVGEMDLHRRPLWNGKKAVGSVNYGIGGLNSDKIASKAYVMLVVSLEQNWKLPVGYFLVDGLTAACRANLIRTCLTKCWDNGVDIIALTCYGCGPNIIAANLLGCELDDIDNLKTTFKHPSPLSKIDVAVFIDPSDMMKLVRNIFESRRLILDCEGREIKWQLLSNLLKLQRSETLTFADKSNPKHIEFRNQILTVKTGTQLLSMSVAKSLKMCKELLKSTRFQNIDGTVQFIENFNNIFDILNSKEGEEGFKSPISSENKIDSLVFIEQMRGYLCSLEIYVKTRRTVKGRIATKVERKKIVESMCITGIVGFIVCIESLKHLYTTLVENNNVEHIATRRFSLDHLKLFFRVFCRHGGNNCNNPNVEQFQDTYRKILGHLKLGSLSENCIPIDNMSIDTLSAVETINQTIERNLITHRIIEAEHTFLIDDICDNGNALKRNKFRKPAELPSDDTAKTNVAILSDLLNTQCNLLVCAKQIIGYIAGWIAKDLIKKINCETCCSALITNKKESSYKLITLKDMGGICYPSCDVFKICSKCENVIKLFMNGNKTQHVSESQMSKLKINVLESFVDLNAFPMLNKHSFDQPATANHRLHLLRAIIGRYCNVRFQNVKEIYPSKRQKRCKLDFFSR